jgi:hypothetical protein
MIEDERAAAGDGADNRYAAWVVKSREICEMRYQWPI